MRAPQKINSYVLMDFETGGIDNKNGNHCQIVPITEVAVLALNGVTLEEIIRYDNLVKPYDDRLQYQPAAAALTGITRELCERDGVELSQVVEDLCQVFTEANIYNSKTARPKIVAHNAPFERQFLVDIFNRCKVDLSKYVSGANDAYGHFVPDMLDTQDFAKACWAETTNKEDKFKLSYCSQKAGLDVIEGHRAMNDVIPSADLIRYFFTRLRSGSSQVTITEGQIAVKHRISFQW